MSRQTKKPAEQIVAKVQNVNLLPSVFATEPNKKMLDSTLDVMTSKGQLLPFKETFGLRSASNKTNNFLVDESNQVRRESQANNMLVSRDANDEYMGKVSYLDIENYFQIKNNPLVDGTVLDKNINILDLPVNPTKLTDYNLFYWVENDLPPCRIHVDPKDDGSAKFSVTQNIITKPFVTIVDDLTGNSLNLQTGMIVYFTGTLAEPTYLTTDLDAPALFYVSGVGDYISLTRTTNVDHRIPNSYLKKRLWDKSESSLEPPAIYWDSEQWDSSYIKTSEPEYVTQEKYTSNTNNWQAIDHWYHISVIRAVATFNGMLVEQIATAANKAKRPIINFYSGVKLYNWPNNTKAEVAALLPYDITRYNNTNLTSIIDPAGYSLKDDDLVVFENNPGVYQVSNLSANAIFTLQPISIVANDGVMIISASPVQFFRLIYKNNNWQFAQNKTEPNQTPLFEFYTSNNVSLQAYNETDFAGGAILGFKTGTTFDDVLQKYVEVSSIDFDLVNEASSNTVSPNQLKLYTDVDMTWNYTNSTTGEKQYIRGPYGFSFEANQNIFSFYKQRSGLDITKQVQDLEYTTSSDEIWSAPISPVSTAMETIHVYYDAQNKTQFYTEIEGFGLTRFSSKKSFNTVEPLLPLVAGKKIKFVCHNLPVAFSLYKTEVIDNITTPQLLAAPYCTNNNITDGIIELDLTSSISLDGGTSYIDNELSIENTLLQFSYATAGSTKLYKTALVKSENKWRFLQNLHLRDKTNPIYNGYDYVVEDYILPDGSFSNLQSVRATTALTKKAAVGDKVLVDSIVANPVQKTAPLSLTVNPLNAALSTLNYYSLYQHATNLKSNATNSREYIDSESILQSSLLGGGTLLKHSSPISKFAIVATQMPYDFADLATKQSKHYDNFLNKLKLELQHTIESVDYTTFSSVELLSIALATIFKGSAPNSFWAHSNMLGWGEQLDNYRTTTHAVTSSTLNFVLTGNFEPISHRAGKEFLLQLTQNGRFLVRGNDYSLITTSDEYTSILFDASLIGTTVEITQWYSRFESHVPASLAKIGLVPVYRPEIYLDTTYSTAAYFLNRHDGTRYYLEDGVDANLYPVDLVDQLLYEYEIAVWANMSYDVRNADFRDVVAAVPGYFRTLEKSYNQARASYVDQTHAWLVENTIYSTANDNYDAADGFTKIYQLGSGDDDTTIVGSWRLIYKFAFDTDRPHTHPWEMLGYTIKPTWWDTYYSWTDSSKRLALELALRTGRTSSPAGQISINTAFARCNNKEITENFPVDDAGQLLAPDDITMQWLNVYELPDSTTWQLGAFGPYEQVFANTHRGIAALATVYFLRAPVLYVNKTWVPGQQIKNAWGQNIDRTTGFWQQGTIEHNYHKSIVDNQMVYTSGMESLFAEFCVLNNKSFEQEVVAKFNNLTVNKEFLLQGFTNKDNVRIQSTSINSQRQTLFVPEESYAVRTVKHFPHNELFYSAVRIVYNGTGYEVYGFNREATYFNLNLPTANSPTIAITVGSTVVKQKTRYETNTTTMSYGSSFTSRFDLYDFLMGYGKYLESVGFVFEQAEGGDIRNWQLSAKQFIQWSNDVIAPGNYIDLNPAADYLELAASYGQLDNLEGTNENVGQCVDRNNKPLFSKDLLVSRNNDTIVISTKNKSNPVYGIKLTFSVYESVVHLDNTSAFGDVYFLPEQSTAKRSFAVGGKKSQAWTGAYFVPGYIFAGQYNNLIPNLDTMTEQGRNLLDIESVVVDSQVAAAVKDQFGLSRNPELRQLFLDESNETLFKNAITYTKGTSQVFASLEPLTHGDSSSTIPYEEYMVRLGEFGNTKNIDYYEFELKSEDLKRDPQVAQVVKFVGNNEPETNDKILYVKDSSSRWVHKPQGKELRFATHSTSYSLLKTSGPILPSDTDLAVDRLEDIDSLFGDFAQLVAIEHYNESKSYKPYEQVRFNGQVYRALTTVSPGTWANNNDKFTAINEPYLPNIYVDNYYRPNPDLSMSGTSTFTPGTWQVLQTIDRSVGIVETCPGPTDVSRARIQTSKPHRLVAGEYVVIVNASSKSTVIDGIWLVAEVEDDYKFYINTRITEVITTGKIFALKPVRFKNTNDLDLATATATKDSLGYAWKQKNTDLELTPSGYSRAYPIAIVDDGLNLNDPEATFDYGNYKVYNVDGTIKTLVKEESLPVNIDEIDYLLIYNHETGKTVARVELFDPKKLAIPAVFKNDIDVIGRVDPAKYNRTTDKFKSVYTSLSWYEEMIGRRWWDTSTVSFSDYEAGDDLTKAKYWGTTTNSRSPDIYEWTKSPVHPSQWQKLVDANQQAFGQTASGTVYVDRSLNSDNYHWVEEQDYTNGNVYSVYYFWVKNKNTIAKESTGSRVYTTRQLSGYMLNPTAAGFAWWAPIGNDAIILKGVDALLNNTSTVVQIKKKSKGNEKHQQWAFISEGSEEPIPEWIHVRFRDSISAHLYYKTVGNYLSFSTTELFNQGDIVKYNGDFYVCRINMQVPSIADPALDTNTWFKLTNVFELTGSLIGTWDSYFWDNIPLDYSTDKFWFWKAKNVPDSDNLHRYNRHGNDIRPHVQSWFVDTLEARRTFIKQLNDTMQHVDITTLSTWGTTRLNDTAYVIADEQIDITKFWTYADYMAEDFVATQSTIVLSDESELYSAGLAAGDYAKVNTGIRDYVIYEKKTDQSFAVVYRTNGAIAFNAELYSPAGLSTWDTIGNDMNTWDSDLNAVFNAIVDSLRYEIFVGTNNNYYAKMICVMFRYVLSEQTAVDWLTKSSTIEPVNLIGQSLTNSETLSRDDISTLSSFYSSVKSYRDKIRGGTITKSSNEDVVVEMSESITVTVTESGIPDSWTLV
jgi:hypothetical protein